MKATCLFAGFFILAAAIGAGSARGAVFTVDLTPMVEVAPDGEYLSAAFDLGVELTAIQSVVLEFVMPAGYEGTFVRSGNSSSSQTLQLKLHDTGTLPDSLIGLYVGGQTGLHEGISTNLPRVAANEQTHVLFYNLIHYMMTDDPGPTPSPLRWPSFLFEGEGQISLYELSSSWSHSLPTGATVSSTNEWLLPPAVEEMRLTITGTVVPEPSSVLFATLAVAAGALRRKR
jgi:hypothetical protein